jgi:O-methyltransferase involved in polyketide biosynthesis
MPVWARAIEPQKNKPRFTDSAAIEIVDSVDFDFSQMSKNLNEINQISWIARCKSVDLIIKDFIKIIPRELL